MKIAILGSGSLGSVFGGLLTEAGLDVTLVNRPNEHLNVLREQGLTLVEDAVPRVVQVKVATDPQQLEPVDLVIVLVKSSATRNAVENAGRLIGPGTIAISLQNGLGNEQILGEYLGEGRVLSGRTYVGGEIIAPGRVQVGIRGRETLLGEMDGRRSERVQRIAALFNRAGLETLVVADMPALIWEKLLINVAGGAICGITRLSYGRLLQVPEAIACSLAAIAEAIQVAQAAGVAVSTFNPRDALDKAVAGLPFDFKPSILQDIERRRPTEIDFINGAVVREGEKHGVPTPVNRTLVAAIKGIEFGFQVQGQVNSPGECP